VTDASGEPPPPAKSLHVLRSPTQSTPCCCCLACSAPPPPRSKFKRLRTAAEPPRPSLLVRGCGGYVRVTGPALITRVRTGGRGCYGRPPLVRRRLIVRTPSLAASNREINPPPSFSFDGLIISAPKAALRGSWCFVWLGARRNSGCSVAWWRAWASRRGGSFPRVGRRAVAMYAAP
jgi:hypothetical protein